MKEYQTIWGCKRKVNDRRKEHKPVLIERRKDDRRKGKE